MYLLFVNIKWFTCSLGCEKNDIQTIYLGQRTWVKLTIMEIQDPLGAPGTHMVQPNIQFQMCLVLILENVVIKIKIFKTVFFGDWTAFNQ